MPLRIQARCPGDSSAAALIQLEPGQGTPKAPGTVRVEHPTGTRPQHVIWLTTPRPDAGSEESDLARSFVQALEAADACGCQSAVLAVNEAFGGIDPLTSCRAAMQAAAAFLPSSDLTLYLIRPEHAGAVLPPALRADIQKYVARHLPQPAASRPPEALFCFGVSRQREECLTAPRADWAPELEDILAGAGESFSEMLLRKIDERGLSDAECYRRANLDRRLFSKIRSSKTYQPSKRTVLALALALELSLPEAQELLQTAGYALSHASRSDLIVEYFIVRGQYNIYEINEALYDFNEKMLSS